MNGTTTSPSEPVVCKHCQSQHVRKYGLYRGTQLYYCDDCKRKFIPNAALFHMKTPANQVSSALQQHYNGMSIRGIQHHLDDEYSNRPSSSTIYSWIGKYTGDAVNCVRGYHPHVGDVWVADETVIKIDRQNAWLWDIIDADTRFLLATRLSTSRTTRDAQMLMSRAIAKAGKAPKIVCTDKLASYLDVDYGKGAEHVQGGPFNIENNTNLIERFHGTLKDRTKVMRGLKNLETAHEFLQGWLVHYNYLRPHEALERSPAEAAGIACAFKTWGDVIRMREPRVRVLYTPAKTEVVNVPRHVPAGMRSSERQPRANRPKPVRMVAPHRTRRGSGITRRSDR